MMTTRYLFVLALCSLGCEPPAMVAPDSDGGGGPLPDAGLSPPDAAADPIALECPPDADARFAEVVLELRSVLAEHDVPGASIALVCGRTTLRVEALGVRRRGGTEPVTPDTRFLLGSTAKMFTAAAALALADDGQVDLDVPVGTYLGAGAYGDVTLGQLLLHTAGMPRDFDVDGNAPLTMAVDNNVGMTMWAPPGRVFLFSDPGYSVAGRVLERATSRLFADLIAERVFAPTGMSAITDRAAVRAGDFSYGHSVDERFGVEPLAPDSRVYDSYHEPTGGVWGSAQDLGRWLMVHLAEEPTLPRSLVDRFHVGVTPTGSPGVDYAYGNSVDRGSIPSTVHQGAYSPGFIIDFFTVPEQGFGVAILASSDAFPGGHLAYYASDRFAELAWNSTLERPTAPASWTSYVGSYLDENEMGHIDVVESGDGLVARFLDRETEAPLVEVFGDHYETMLDGKSTGFTFWRPEGGDASYIVSFSGIARRMD